MSHSRDQPFNHISDLPNIFTTYRKSVEPLRNCPRESQPRPNQLPPLPPELPPQAGPFMIPNTLEDLKSALLKPFADDSSFGLPEPPSWPAGTLSAHPFTGGETAAQERLSHLISSGAMTRYKATRNGMLGLDFSTKLSAYLNIGNLTARQIHWAMFNFEEGRGEGENAEGYGRAETEGTAAVRFELLWRDYMRLCTRKYGNKLFDVHGFRSRENEQNPKLPNSTNLPASQSQNTTSGPSKKHWAYLDQNTRPIFTRFCAGRTGASLIDASNRELILTGYTSNRARQNVASFLSSHLGLDWRLGAEWYEFLLIDYDVSNNWGNWQYVAGVGNDPRLGRTFNPVKQALDYDPKGEYVRAWLPELRGVKLVKDKFNGSKGDKDTKGVSETEEIDENKLLGLYQPWSLPEEEKVKLGLKGLDWVDKPLVKIPFSVGGRGRGRGNGEWRGRGRGRGRFRGRAKGSGRGTAP